MGDAKPTSAGLAAAQEVLLRHPCYANGRDASKLLISLAQFCDDDGLDRFRLVYGLREPANPIKAATVAHLAGRLTDEEFRDAVKREATRPVDERKLRCVYRALEEQVVAYGRFTEELERQARAIQLDYCGQWDRPALAARHAAATQKLGVLSSELENVFLFVNEARAERCSGLVRTGETTADTATWLAIRLHHTLQQLWTMAI